jgi:hypothetical protein
MKKTKRSVVVFIIVGVLILGLAGAFFYYLQNKADASVIGYDGTSCPNLVAADPSSCGMGTWAASTPTANGCPMPPRCVITKTPSICPEVMPPIAGWCADGVVEQQPADANGCPGAPICKRDKVVFNLNQGWNIVVIPEYMYRNTNPISSSAFTSAGLTVYNFTEGNWQANPSYLREGGSYLVKNPGNAKSVTVLGIGAQAVGAYLGQVLTVGWNMIANNSESPKLLTELNYKTYVPDPDCHTMPACGEIKTLANLFTESRIYSKVYFFNDLTSSDPDVFYSVKQLSSADLASYRVPAKSAFWVYLFR